VSDPRLQTRATALFGVQYPIVQTGMGWVATAKLTAATANAGGLGIVAAAPMTFDQMRQAIDDVRAATDKPFGVNLRTDAFDIDARVDHLIKVKVKVASFAQAPGEKVVKKLKDAGIVVMPTIGARRHAEKVAAWGVDAVIAQGAEGGGHTGVVPTSILLPQVLDAVDIPVIVNALKFRKLTGTSYADLLREGLAMKKSQDLSWSQLALAANAPMLTKAAIVDGHPEVGILPTGQGVGAIDELPTCQELIDRVVAQATAALDRVCGPRGS
jgi:NAD(P)H-dependent flavin oxidoreductase YrpB (nitropropane dioxygenase family)